MKSALRLLAIAGLASGGMVRTERYKYCVYSRGRQRESLVDLQADPGEMVDLATDPDYREILLRHRQLLTRFGQEHHDPLVAELLADNVKPIPFQAGASPRPANKQPTESRPTADPP